MPIERKRSLVEPEQERLSIVRQCELLGMSRAAYYYEPWEWDETALAMLRAEDAEPILTRSTAVGSLMRRKLEPLLDPLIAHLGSLRVAP